MQINVNAIGDVEVEEAYKTVVFKHRAGKGAIGVQEDDNGFFIYYGGQRYAFRDGLPPVSGPVRKTPIHHNPFLDEEG